MSRPSLVLLRFTRILAGQTLLLLTVVGLSGCGGGSEADSDTQASAESSSPGTDYGGGDYGGESEAGATSGGAYGGGAYGGGSRGGRGQGSSSNDGYGGDGYDGGGMGGAGNYSSGNYSTGNYGGEMAGGMMGGPGYAGGDGYAGGGYAGGMGGVGGNANPQLGTMIQFVRQNCVQCHGPQLTKGDVRLDRLSGNFEDQRNATTWSSVLEQLDSGQMPPKSVQRRPDLRQQQGVVSWIKSSLSTANFVPLEEQDYLSQAEYAFASGKERAGVDLLYAHTVAADDEVAKEVLTQAKWSTVGLRPALALRFAIGVVLSAPDDLDDLKPLGTTQAGGGGGGGSYGGEGYGAGGAGTQKSTERTFQQLTGAFGEAVVNKFESRWVSGSLGTVFKDVEESQPVPATGMGGGGYGGAGYGQDGYAGGGFAGDGGEMGFGGGGMGGESATSKRKPVQPGSIITPGLTFIGVGNQAELIAKATELGVDGLFVFDVKVEQNRRTRLVNNDTRLRLLSMLDGKALAATSTLNNVDIERNKMRGIEDDSLDKNTERFFTMFDEKVRLDSMPPLKPEHAQSRMRQLLVDKQTGNLPKLFEARLYHSLGLLTSDEMSQLFQIVLRGNEGVALASGSVDDRRLVLGEILTN